MENKGLSIEQLKKAKFSYDFKNLVGKVVKLWVIDQPVFDKFKKEFDGEVGEYRMQGVAKETCELQNGVIICKMLNYEKNNYFLFLSKTEMDDFFTSEYCNFVICGINNGKLVLSYSLKPSFLKELLKKEEGVVVENVYNNLHQIYKFNGYEGVFMIINNNHRNSGFWYPTYEMFKEDYNFQINRSDE